MHKYLKDRILDELADAVAYMEKAVEHKRTDIGKAFCHMSKNEIEHANMLYKIYSREEKPADLPDAEYSAMTKAIMDAYQSGMGRIEAAKKLYWA
jgi:hypothetical protein